MSKWTAWYDSLPEHTKTYLKAQPLWHDKDLATVGAVTFIIGLLLGLAV